MNRPYLLSGLAIIGWVFLSIPAGLAQKGDALPEAEYFRNRARFNEMQSVNPEKVSFLQWRIPDFEINNMPLEEALQKLQTISRDIDPTGKGILFVISPSLKPFLPRPLSFHLRDVPVADLLRVMSSLGNFSIFQLSDKIIIYAPSERWLWPRTEPETKSFHLKDPLFLGIEDTNAEEALKKLGYQFEDDPVLPFVKAPYARYDASRQLLTVHMDPFLLKRLQLEIESYPWYKRRQPYLRQLRETPFLAISRENLPPSERSDAPAVRVFKMLPESFQMERGSGGKDVKSRLEAAGVKFPTGTAAAFDGNILKIINTAREIIYFERVLDDYYRRALGPEIYTKLLQDDAADTK